ncbi:TonB-dependent receptor [bacterium]|nr:TonB-dependent receptor [bacterium]MBU1633355.1 TonB-dependent receptor [bacterium]MBU1875058.1 TonB-dependent receptor [bacterium]
MVVNYKKWSVFIAIFLCVSVYSGGLSARTGDGSLKGVVRNAKNEPLFGANVILPKIDRGAGTDERGEFSITQLPAGTYKVAVKYIGYRSESRDVTIQGGKTTRIEFTLEQSVIETEAFVVTGRPTAADPLNSPQDISSVSGREKIRLQSASLGKTIESIPGITNMSTGTVAGKPVIHGLTGERICILSDGIAQEYQQYGERHAPNIESFNYDRVEVIKGAASLLYGSDALGGAVNLIPYRFQIAADNALSLNGAFSSAYYSNNNESMTGLKFGGSKWKLGFTGSLVCRNAGNFHTPDAATYSETQEEGDPKFTGEIDYTDFEQINGSLAAAYLSSLGLFAVNYDHYYNSNNFLLPTGLPIGLRLENRIVTIKGNMPFGSFIFKPRFSYQRNHRQATESGKSRSILPDSANVDLVLNVYTGRFEVEQGGTSKLTGTLGVEIKHYDHENIGAVPLQPTGHFTNSALFAFEEWQTGKLTLDFGARFDYRHQKFFGSTSNPLLLEDDDREYSALSGALGASYKLTDILTAAANVGRGFRTPSFYNLYVYGYHGGVFAFQIGNPDLKNETSLDISSSLRLRTDKIEANTTVYQNRIDNYIFLYNASDHPLAPEDAGFVFAHDQANAILHGMDLSASVNIPDWLIVSGSYSLIKSKFANGLYMDDELPLMPANQIVAEIKFLLPNLPVFHAPYALLHIKHVGAKSAAGIYEPFGQFDDGIGPDILFGVCSTDAYTLLSAGVGFDVNLMKMPMNLDIEVSNLLNETYRDFLDTYKGYTLAPGRSVNFKINIPLGI